MGVASLVLGILSLIIGVISAGTLGWLGAIFGIIGIVLGVMGKKNPEKKGIAAAGFVCSIIGTSLCILMYFACVACIGTIAMME